jgi:hypothetical protein
MEQWGGKRLRCHPEHGEGSLICPPYSYGRRGFFTEFTLSRLLRFFAALRMTKGDGFRMTFLNLMAFHS